MDMDLNLLRSIAQWISLIGSNIYLGFFKTKQVYQGPLKSACVPFLNCNSCPSALFSCPVGALQHFMTLRKIPFTILGYLLALGLAVGAMTCGWLCPFGFLQDLMVKVPSPKIKLPKRISELRYWVLVLLVVLVPLMTQETWYSKLCPMGTLQAALPWALWNPVIPVYGEQVVSPSSYGLLFAVKIVILLVFLVLFVVSKRPFCRTACPLGAILGFLNRYSWVQLKVDSANCKDCFGCAKTCPVDLQVGEDPNASTCVRCLKCLDCKHVHLMLGGLKEEVDLGFLRARKTALQLKDAKKRD
jgi:polyferredoxin